MEIFVLCNGKGGSGKTTTAYHLARWLAAQGRPPLIWGLDADVHGITAKVRATHHRPTGADAVAGGVLVGFLSDAQADLLGMAINDALMTLDARGGA